MRAQLENPPLPRRAFLQRIGAGALGAAALASPARAATRERRAEIPLYIGTYTRGRSRGIYLGRIDTATGTVAIDGVAEGVENPSFLTLDPARAHLFAVSEVGDFAGTRGGGVVCFAIEPGGRLRQRNGQPTHGGAPCHLVVDATGRFVLAANYSGGNVTVLPILADGSLGPATDVVQHRGSGPDPRQEAPHTHSVNLDAANRFAVVADLGTDQLVVYRLDAAEGKLAPTVAGAIRTRPGAGPRHFAFHPDGRRGYVINELDSTVTALSYDPSSGMLEPVTTASTLPADFTGTNSCADVHVAPSGRYVYGSNRGHDSIAVFVISPDGRGLVPIQHQSTRGRTPRNFGIVPGGRFLVAANQDSDSLTVFSIDADSGRLSPVGDPIDVPVPVCVRFG